MWFSDVDTWRLLLAEDVYFPLDEGMNRFILKGNSNWNICPRGAGMNFLSANNLVSEENSAKADSSQEPFSYKDRVVSDSVY